VRAVLQRVTQAQVRVDGAADRRGRQRLDDPGLRHGGDTDTRPERLAAKVAKLRIFKDDQGKMNLSVRDIGGSGPGGQPVHPGRRPARQPPRLFHRRRAREGKRLYRHFSQCLETEGVPVETASSAPTWRSAW
jgi:D-tyrosyl-tRNA(Tyr) deacylase